MGRKMNTLQATSQMNRDTGLICEGYFWKLKALVEVGVRLVYIEDNVQQDGLSSAKSVLNLLGFQENG